VSQSLGVTFDQAIWIMIGGITLLVFSVWYLARRRRKQLLSEIQEDQAQAVGFSSYEGYLRSWEQRRARIEPQVFDSLVAQVLQKSEPNDLVSFEKTFTAVASGLNVDVSLSDQDFTRSRAGSILGQIQKRLLRARLYILGKTIGAFVLTGLCFWLLLCNLKIVEGLVSSIVTAPLWGFWAFLGGLLSFFTVILTVLLRALNDSVAVVERISAEAVRKVVQKVAATDAGVRVSALPEVLKSWRDSALGERSERRSSFSRVASFMGGWLLKRVQGMVQKRLLKENKDRDFISTQQLEAALVSGAASALTGPFASQLRLARGISQALLTVFVLISVALPWVAGG
jgi:hypothetical protein